MQLVQSRRKFMTLVMRLSGGALLASMPQISFGAVHRTATKNLTADEAEKLFLLTRILFPHEKLGDDFYWHVVGQFDLSCADPHFMALIRSGLTNLDKTADLKWSELSKEKKIELLRKIQLGAFFQTVRILTLLNLYGNAHVGRKLGYEGRSYEHGGYLNRGFNDLSWLPEPKSCVQ